MMRKNWLVTLAGAMTALGGVPILVATSGVSVPSWWGQVSFFFVLTGVIGGALLGWAAKGQDEHSTQQQVQDATTVKQVEGQKQ